MKGKQSRLLNLFAAKNVRTTPEKKIKTPSSEKELASFWKQTRTAECTKAAKFVVLPLPSLLLLHQSHKEPGMKRIKAPFGDRKKKKKKVPEKKKRGGIKAGLESGERAARG